MNFDLKRGLDPDPDPAFHSNAEPDPASQNNADQDPDPGLKILVLSYLIFLVYDGYLYYLFKLFGTERFDTVVDSWHS